MDWNKKKLLKNMVFLVLFTQTVVPIIGLLLSGRVSKHQLTEVGRALKQLGIQHIAAYSSQARGRSERMFGTLQNRLPKE